ncbi:hypothetical protein TREVI0001_1016 [Treponema vincentii ATCC 35580]|uniref:Uncharacterized protein n=1 Tax=Treponema vincentii ATCC 35580 TaxID=596324 RepID=C8PTA3_9SPIR|nr:hypothetical protein TREVI0001_1016 [Treponema vincentii ATCC 35580]
MLQEQLGQGGIPALAAVLTGKTMRRRLFLLHFHHSQ